MTLLLNIFILIPLAGLAVSLLIPEKKEIIISRAAYFTVGLHLFSVMIYVAYWLFSGSQTLHIKDLVLYSSPGYEFFIDFCFDKISAVYLTVGSFLTFLVTAYSRSYLHREEGYKRFFNALLFFFFGYNIVVLSGNLETLFIGWEILGISSFLLIAFYRNRYLPVKNAIKVFSIYRVGDVGIILAIWLSHHFWHENITFLKLGNYELVHSQLQSHTLAGVFISLMILVSAAAKSAQLPFSSWLPRALEGPTPSSAIFYGSLSVHLGVFLLMRTFPFWEHQLSVRILIAVLGLSTSIIATGIARVQSSVKSQIAYASIAQIGLIFVELAAGLENLALWHFAGNAFLRTYQLLISPSVASYLIKEQFYNFTPRPLTFEDSLPKKIEFSFYIMCLKEWNLDSLVYRIFWRPFKLAGRKLHFLDWKKLLYLFIPIYMAGVYLIYHKELLSPHVHQTFTICFSLIALIMAIRSFSERKSIYLSWFLISMNQFWIALGISFNENFEFGQIYFFLSGVVFTSLLGLWVIRKLFALEKTVGLGQFQGYAHKHPKLSFLFLIACLGLMGFPITPTFIGEDLLFTHIREDQAILALLTALSFIVNGLALIRVFSKIFFGPYSKAPEEMALRSA